MKYSDIKPIMEKCHIPPAYYRVNDKGAPPAEIFFGLDHKNGKYHFFIMERNNFIEDHYYMSENDACIAFLRALSLDYPQLKRYIA